MSAPLLAFDTEDATSIQAPELERYWKDRKYRQRCDAETFHARRLAHEAIDRGMAALNARQQARWDAEAARDPKAKEGGQGNG